MVFSSINSHRYGPLGAAITWLTGIIVSYFTGGQDINESNVGLLAPCIQYLLPQKYKHKPLKVITEKLEDFEKVQLM